MPAQNRKIVYAGRLIDAVSDCVRKGVSIVIEGGLIREVRNGRLVITDAEIIDLSDSTVMPGFIDCHTHLTFQLDTGRTLRDLLFRRDADLALEATAYARRTLLAGFTTVRDVGAPDPLVDIQLLAQVSFVMKEGRIYKRDQSITGEWTM